ncbi:hypothetical protein BABINDRAFT_62012 [Babjeviella inositovora NRRL Y-12698]|uniref:Uncharacterized protein n=1 Tax=Babjeviella inositovora NRRL Y-12698 TaxID=984486 RepID=A0A1E3QPY3_9ASCO|nr:uncharacterized protein BABINDRAFT_62012 [Babjeviella inositovora NRRL Y-12698]ODQ79766.1 hypothetical protein BABINDRAFT_62012 [Babjeviella inositovora NRRL Y-12698]
MPPKKPVYKSPFQHPYFPDFPGDGVGMTARCKEEWAIVEISTTIRLKPEWWTKYKDQVILEKWRKELQEQSEEATPAVIDYVFQELEWYEKLKNESGDLFQPMCHESIFASLDGIQVIEDDLKSLFRREAFKLLEEGVSEGKKDWHPNSNNQVLDLVHPSLYPLQYGLTPVLQSDGSTKPAPFDKDLIKSVKPQVENFGVSERFQWLPSIFKVNKSGEHLITIESYINNLHPVRCRSLYQPIGDIFARCVPGINSCLSRAVSTEYVRIDVPYGEDETYDEEFLKEIRKYTGGDDEAEDGRDPWDIYEEIWDTREDHIKPLEFSYTAPPETKKFDITDFNDLRVITKLANIVLTPESPEYPGGSWHVEGTINEDIVATVLYYYDSENITESNLSFRMAFNEPQYEQGDDVFCRVRYGLENEQNLTHRLGSVEAKENRVTIFPNVFQHHVDAFKLSDPSKPGHRKILCFFIVDPYNEQVVATDKVPPQQHDLWVDSLKGDGYLTKFPVELFNKITDLVDWPITLEKAKKVREELIGERSETHATADGNYDYEDLTPFTREFSLCEH